jgi:hypothetical protein
MFNFPSQVMILILIIAIIKIIAVYSVGRSHGQKGFKIQYPTLNEWVMIVIYIAIIGWIGTFVGKQLMGNTSMTTSDF